MKIERAIEIKSLTREELLSIDPDEIAEADRLGIEALKRTNARREKLSWEFEPLLPGETTDV